jgi:hypothetical protein
MAAEYQRSAVPEEFREQDPVMTKPQADYLAALIEERQMTDEQRVEARAKLAAGLTKKEASAWISKALTLPRSTSQFARNLKDMPAVPDGRYAIEHPDVTEGVLKFYRVRTGGSKDPRWAGYIFIDAGRGGAHDDLQWTPIKDVAYKRAVLELIEKDPKAAGQKFGQEVGSCCHCGRSLTQEHTRARGTGDDCFERHGW